MDLEWVKHLSRKVEKGDRVELIHMPDDPDPIASGSLGTVISVDSRMGVVDVKWDSGRTINLIMGVDNFKIVNESKQVNVVVPKKEEITTPSVADKHNVSISELQMEVEKGVEFELGEHENPLNTKKVVLENLNKDINHYKKRINLKENFFGSIGNAFGVKKNKDDQFSVKEMGSELERIMSVIKTSDVRHMDTTKKMIENFREKYSEHSKIGDIMKSLYYELDNPDELDETTSAGAAGSFSGPLFGKPQKRNESRIIKVKDLLESTTTINSGKYDNESKSPFDSNKDGWFWNDKPWFKGGEIVDDVAQLDHNWKDELLSVNMNESKSLDEEELEETTTASSSGQYSGPMFAAKDDSDWETAKKPIWKGGKIVQKVKNSGVLSEINKTKYHKDGDYVKIKDKCAKYDNQPFCSQGDIDKPLVLSKTTNDNISEAAKKLGISEYKVKEIINNKLSR